MNFFGIIRTVKAFLPRLKQQALQDGYRGARILNMVSVAGLVSSRGFGAAPYFSSKRAAQCFSQCLRYELQPFHVQVGTINPTCHGTPLVLGAVDAQKRKWMALSEKNRREYGEGELVAFSSYPKRELYCASLTGNPRVSRSPTGRNATNTCPVLECGRCRRPRCAVFEAKVRADNGCCRD